MKISLRAHLFGVLALAGLLASAATRAGIAPEEHAVEADSLPEVVVTSKREDPEFDLFTLNATKLREIGGGSEVGVAMQNSLVQVLPNKSGSGDMCNPAFINKRAPCQDGELFISFVRHLNSKNAIPKRGTCYCVSRSAIDGSDANKGAPQMSGFVSFDSKDYNALDERFMGQIGLVDPTNNPAPVWSKESRFIRDPHKLDQLTRYLETENEMYRISENAEYSYTVDLGYKQRQKARELLDASFASTDWKTKDGKERSPYSVGIESELYKKDGMLAEYAERTVKSLGTEFSPFALFHNAWKLSRLTRTNNDITLKLINDSVLKQLTIRFKDPKIVARLMPKYEAFNKYIWETMHTEAQELHPDSPESAVVDDHFKAALREDAHNTHREMWNLLAELDNEASQVLATADTTKMGKAISLSDTRKINEYTINTSAMVPSSKLKRRDMISKHPGVCPCDPKSPSIPDNLEVRSLTDAGFQQSGLSFGRGVTYQLVDERSLPAGLRSQKIRSKRTGYSAPNNSPAGSTRAGFAALRRSGSNGMANLGRGTLDSPITAAISRGAAQTYGICQGDMIHDPNFGWLRVEGGCTSDFNDIRIDVWRGNTPTRDLWTVEFDPDNRWNFTHFPAGLVDVEYARKHPR